MRKQVWTTGRKWIGNLIPLPFFLGPVAYGLWLLFSTFHPDLRGNWWIGGGFVSGWLSLNLFGLTGNRKLRKELIKRFGEHKRLPHWFVGFARPSYRSALDPHEDLGFLMLHADELEFEGDSFRIALQKQDITRIHFLPNTHSLLLLGRWIAIEGTVESKSVRMLIEPRERGTLIGNLFFGVKVKKEIEGWLKRNPPKSKSVPVTGMDEAGDHKQP